MSRQDRVGRVHTNIFEEGGFKHVKYWNTNVVSFDQKTIRLNTGGFMTKTTKTRMNQASNQFGLGFNVSQKNFKWFVDYEGKKQPLRENVSLLRW